MRDWRFCFFVPLSLNAHAHVQRSVSKLGWKSPTLVQQAAIPLALQGKDLLVHAKTGTGKTACYALPVIQSVLVKKRAPGYRQHVSALVLVPTKELSRQVKGNLEELCRYCDDLVSVAELAAAAETTKEQKALLRDLPDIVVATPARIAARLADRSLDASQCSVLVVDEADLVLGYGYADDVASVLKQVPAARQTFLMSATLGAEVQRLQKQALNRPALLKLEEGDEEEGGDAQLRQLSLRADRPQDRFLICYVMLKLRLVLGKTIFFVNSVDQGFRLQLFLNAFFIPSLMLNSELPENSRNYILQEFNRGKCSLLIATDESHLLSEEPRPQRKEAAEEEEEQDDVEEDEEGQGGKKRRREAKGAAAAAAPELEQVEYGVSRGFDFKHVANVINFDFPATPEAYVHRIGRTARAGARGNAISFVSSDCEAAVLAEAAALQDRGGAVQIKPFSFKMSAVEGFRYRVEDVLNQITREQIKEARANELKQEILRSAALKQHFQEHPRDLEVLAGGSGRPKRNKMAELKHVPDYLRPTAQDNAQIKQAMNTAKIEKRKKRPFKTGKKKKNDPLRTLRGGKK